MSDWNADVINDFRSMRGTSKDRLVEGMFPHDSLVLLHTTGARSGRERVNPLAIWRDDHRIYVTGSAGGAPQHPAWFYNVLANPDVTVEIGDETFRGRAHNIENRAEHDRIYQKFIDMAPQFAEYERSTGGRVIPVVAIDLVGD